MVVFGCSRVQASGLLVRVPLQRSFAGFIGSSVPPEFFPFRLVVVY